MKIFIRIDEKRIPIQEIPLEIIKFLIFHHKIHTGFSMTNKQRLPYVRLMLKLKPSTAEMVTLLYVIDDNHLKHLIIAKILSSSPSKDDVIRILIEERNLPSNLEFLCCKKMIEFNAYTQEELQEIQEKFPELKN